MTMGRYADIVVLIKRREGREMTIQSLLEAKKLSRYQLSKISKEQAWYLREKYLRLESSEMLALP